ARGEHAKHACLRLQHRAQLALRRALVRTQARGLALAGTLPVVRNRIDAAAARRQHHHPEPGQHRRQGQGDDQPDHRLAQGVAALVVHQVLPVTFVGHYIGPKNVVSTVSLSSPSTLRMVKTTSWRPVTEAGALSTTGSDRTSSGCARTGCGMSRSTMPGGFESTSMVNASASATLLTSLTV